MGGKKKKKEHSIFHYKTGTFRFSKCIALVSLVYLNLIYWIKKKNSTVWFSGMFMSTAKRRSLRWVLIYQCSKP